MHVHVQTCIDAYMHIWIYVYICIYIYIYVDICVSHKSVLYIYTCIPFQSNHPMKNLNNHLQEDSFRGQNKITIQRDRYEETLFVSEIPILISRTSCFIFGG